MEQEKLLNAFPSSMQTDVEKVISILPIEKSRTHIGSSEESIFLNKENLKIPSRIYFNEPFLQDEIKLTDLQKTILNCIYLRHENGFIRQRRLEKLVDKTDYFVVPFTLQLLGEYVIEILKVLQRHINSATIDNYVKFIKENQAYWEKTERRVISYWNEYYRRPQFPKFNDDYVGKKIVDRLNLATQPF